MILGIMKHTLTSISLVATLFLVFSFAGSDILPPANAGFNTYQACYKKCTKSDKPLEQNCRAQSCKKLKGTAKSRCNKLCGMKEGIYDYCKASCTKRETCLRSKPVKSCLKTCGQYRGSQVRKYQKCKKECEQVCPEF